MSFVFSIANYEAKEILQNDASWVKECQDNRVYLNTGHIVINENRIFVLNKLGEKISIFRVGAV
jgi:hypothetical protein